MEAAPCGCIIVVSARVLRPSETSEQQAFLARRRAQCLTQGAKKKKTENISGRGGVCASTSKMKSRRSMETRLCL